MSKKKCRVFNRVNHFIQKKRVKEKFLYGLF